MRGGYPRIPYRARNVRQRGGFSTPLHSRNIRAQINNSDSDYYSESSGDIKVISVQKTTANRAPLLLSDEEYDSSYSYSSPNTNISKRYVSNEPDWNSKKTTQNASENKKGNRATKTPNKSFHISDYHSSYSYSSDDNQTKPKEQPNLNSNSNNNPNNIKRTNIKETANPPPIPNSQANQMDANSNNIIQSNDNFTQPNDTKNNENDNKMNEEINKEDGKINENNENKTLVDPIQELLLDSSPFKSYIVARKGKKISKVSFELIEDNVSLCKSFSKKEGNKSIHLLYKENIIDESVSSLPIYVGYIRSRRKKHFYTFFTTDKKNERDDREGEILSISFGNLENQENDKLPQISVVIPKYGEPNYPITQRLSLETMADSENIDNTKFIKFVGTEINLNVEKEFGSSFYTKSGKNCALIDPISGKYVFIFLKSNYEIFNLKIKPPLTFLQGFAIAIALIKHGQ